MVVPHGGSGEIDGGGIGGGRSESVSRVLLKEAMTLRGEVVPRVKSEQLTMVSEDDDDDDVEGEKNGVVLSERKTSEVTTTEEDFIEAVPAVRVKLEEAVDAVDGDFGGGVNGSSSSSTDLPKPMEGLHEAGPPPFLKKTFEMVEDPETDPIVSWSEARDSFIVWDSHEFSKILLPKYFKHSNFSSFIRQLNTYVSTSTSTSNQPLINFSCS